MNKKIIEDCIKKMLEDGLGFDLDDPNLKDTPKRIAKMYVEEIFSGLLQENEPKISVFPNDKKYSQMILSDKIYFSSMCSHHFLPFSGYAWVLYIPKDVVLGLSKFSRVVDYFARRPQLQENLTEQIKDYIIEKSNPLGTMVVLRALHQCMHCRGVKQHAGAGMVTSAIYGEFEKSEVRSEAMSLIQLSNLISY